LEHDPRRDDQGAGRTRLERLNARSCGLLRVNRPARGCLSRIFNATIGRSGSMLQSVKTQSKLTQWLKEWETRALLLTTLELRLPMTRVLSVITKSLPGLVSLNNCQADTRLKETSNVRSDTLPLLVGSEEKKLFPFNSDLTELPDAANL